jgi:tetratricopeptide (TPR) repeat protein
MHNCSILKQEHLNRGWSYATVETKTGIPQRSQENAENGYHFPRQRYIEPYSNLYGKSPKELGLDKSDRIGVGNTNAPTSQEEQTPMSDLIRREVFRNLGSRLTSLVDAWPKHNYQYAELQEGINQAILGYNTIVVQEPTYELTRRQAVKDLILVPMQLAGGIALISSGKVKKADTDLLLKHCAAGIAAGWYLRRGKELTFVSDAVSTYISLLRPLIYSLSENYHKTSATLLSQCFRLKSYSARGLQDNDQEAIAYEEEAIRYALMADNVTEQAIANREMASVYGRSRKYKQALPYAEKAYALAPKNAPKIIRSFIASGLSLYQAATGYPDDAQISLKEAHDLFDPSVSIAPMPYGEAILIAIAAAVKQHSGVWSESVDLYKKSLTIPDISALGSIQQRINYAKTEVSRDDVHSRDMNLCITLLTEAITGAKDLDSKWYIREAHETFDLFRIAWPREDAIKRLGKDHFGLK